MWGITQPIAGAYADKHGVDHPLTLELAGVAALYAQCVRVRVGIRLRLRGAPNPNPSPNLSLTRCVDGLWLLSYSHPFSAHQAFCLGLG